MQNTLNLHSIESFGTHDGPGIRLVIFLQGCNIKCAYCHNPDTIINSGGTPTSIDEIVERAIKMKPYFGDLGGVTISGGEPTVQSNAVIHLCNALHNKGIHTNIDTNGTITTAEAQNLLTNIADLVMFDIKGVSEQQFKKITQSSKLANVLENITLREKAKKPYWLRYVLIPEITDSKESLDFLIQTFSKNEYLEKLEILPYHKLGIHKWKELGWEYTLEHCKENSEENLASAQITLSEAFGNKLEFR